MKGKYPWIVLTPDNCSTCKRCGDKLDLNLVTGQRIEVFIGLTQGFVKAHRSCKERDA